MSADKRCRIKTDWSPTSVNCGDKQLERFIIPGPAEMELRMTLTVGKKVFYPGRGPCLISDVVQKVVCKESLSFYRLALLDDSRAEVFVPVDSLRGLPLRALLDRSEIPKLLNHLKPRSGVVKDPGIAKNWRQRELDNAKLFSSGSVFDLADVVESLTQLSSTKTLAPHDRDTLYRAKKLLICEISEVMDESKSAAEARIDSVLDAAKKSQTNQLSS
jgi:RNA polymerase-interacting CarD/CdnL/TRCF family regulator